MGCDSILALNTEESILEMYMRFVQLALTALLGGRLVRMRWGRGGRGGETAWRVGCVVG